MVLDGLWQGGLESLFPASLITFIKCRSVQELAKNENNSTYIVHIFSYLFVFLPAFKAVEGLYGPWWIRFPHASASPRPEHCFSTGIFVLI